MEHPDPAISELLNRYADIVREWAPRLDLVSPTDLPRFEERHIADSLRALPAVIAAGPGPCVDVGSGAGLPGIPLAIASGRVWRLLEPRARRAGFLEEAVRELGLPCEVIRMSAAEAAAAGFDAAHVVATARALAKPDEAVAICRPLVSPGGYVLVFHGERSPGPAESEEIAPGIAKVVVTE
ncbi:MAG: rRNA (guanine527-N7)-methyltransferase [Actinomycetota bacterium]|nr:rRNA (guanine527-N7)-methyltransferase [Actinomycetota bacterium]